MPARFRLSTAAEADLRDIGLFGADRWSIRQADDYENGLRALIELIAENPGMAPDRGLASKVRALSYRSHIVAYRIMEEGILVVRVLHGRSDWLLKDTEN